MPRTNSLSKPATFVFPDLSEDQSKNTQNAPKKKKTSAPLRSPPPLTTLPTFSNSAPNFRSQPKPLPKPVLKRVGGATGKALTIGRTNADKVLLAKLKKSERKSIALRTPVATLTSMSETQFRSYLDSKIAAIFAVMLDAGIIQTKKACEETISIQNAEKFWGSTLLTREVDRMFFTWVFTIVDPCVVWTPPFTHTNEFKTYAESQIVSGSFPYASKVKGDITRFWIVARDRRDTLDQKKLRYARASAKSYKTALRSVKQSCMNEMTSMENFTPESCWDIFMTKIVVSTGFQRVMKNWIAQFSIMMNSQTLKSLQSILEVAILKSGVDCREDFAKIYRQALEVRKMTSEEDIFVTQPPTQMDWSML